MKKLSLIIGTLIVVLMPAGAFAAPVKVKPHNELLDLVGRYERGTITADIQRVQSYRHITATFCADLPRHVPNGDPRQDDIDACVQYGEAVGRNYSEIGMFRSQWYCAMFGTSCQSQFRY